MRVPGKPATPGDSARAEIAGATVTAAATPVRDSTTLPPEQAPFSASYPELRRLADAGSPRAACRLAFELLRCQAFAQDATFRQSLEQQERKDENNGMAWAADASANRQIELANRTADCRKLPPGAYTAASGYLWRAASAGNLAAQVRYIRGQMFGKVAMDRGGDRDLGYLHHPEFERWHRRAPAMARELLASHPWVGASLLGSAYLGDGQVFDALIPNDEVQAWAFNLAVRDARGAPPMNLDRFDAAQRQRLETLRRQIPKLDPGKEALDAPAVDAMVAPGESLGEWSGSYCSEY